MSTQRVDFKELRQRLRFEDVLALYNVEFKHDRIQQNILCPLPKHPTRGEGRKRTASLSINLTKGIWNCHGCGANGNMLEFAAHMEGLNPDDTSDFRKAALKLQRALMGKNTHSATSDKEEGRPALELARPPEPELEVVINAPLDFQLQNLDYTHPYLRDRGFSDGTIESFGLGFCSRGMMNGRVVIPLKDQAGRLVGYGGRLVDDSAVTDECPKYLFPGPREKGGKRYEFHKSEFLYQGSFVFQDGPIKELIIVEGFPSVWWLNQAGISHVVATMGSSLSETQAHLVIEHMAKGGLVYAMADGDKAGARLAAEIFEKIGPFVPVRWIQMGTGKQPTDHDPAALRQLLSS